MRATNLNSIGRQKGIQLFIHSRFKLFQVFLTQFSKNNLSIFLSLLIKNPTSFLFMDITGGQNKLHLNHLKMVDIRNKIVKTLNLTDI